MDINQLECAILRLGEMLGEYEKMDGLDRLLQEAIKESLIQRFEYTSEVSWKAVKRYLTEYQGYQDAMGPKPVIRLGGQLGILDAGKWKVLGMYLEIMPAFWALILSRKWEAISEASRPRSRSAGSLNIPTSMH